MEAITIREAAEADLAAVLNVYTQAGLQDAGFELEEARHHFKRFHTYPSYRLFVAESAGAVCGTYSLLIVDSLAKRGRPSGLAENVGVLPGYQGRGVGRAMMEHALAECRRAGCYKLSLSSNLRREAAHAFYDALGFERHGYSFVVSL